MRCLLLLAWPERLTLASALAMLVLSWSAESHQALKAQANPPTTAAATEAQRIRQVILCVMESIDARRWQALGGQFAGTVLVDYTALFGGYPRRLTLNRRYGGWQIQKIVLDVQSQEGNTNLLVEAFAPARGR